MLKNYEQDVLIVQQQNNLAKSRSVKTRPPGKFSSCAGWAMKKKKMLQLFQPKPG